MYVGFYLPMCGPTATPEALETLVALPKSTIAPVS
jgi:hypothetical protein